MDLFHFVKSLPVFSWNTIFLILLSLISTIITWYVLPFTVGYVYPYKVNFIPEELDFLTQVLLLGIWIKVYLRLFDFFRICKYNKMYYNIKFKTSTEKKFKEDWEFQGNPIICPKGLLLTNSNSGLLIRPDKFWSKDFKATIEIVFRMQKRKINKEWYEYKGEFKERDRTKTYKKLFGIIFRAQDLENYFLLEVWRIGNYIVIRPHVRIDGNWDAPILNPEENSMLFNKLRKFTMIFTADEKETTLYINNQKLTWVLPTHYEINLRHNLTTLQGDLKEGNVRKIPFRLSRGRFGFRNYGDELAYITSLNIEPLKDQKGKVFKS